MPVDAATVAILRDGESSLEVLLVERTGSAGFVPGAHVFPGGAVDAADELGVDLVEGLGDAQASAQTGVESGGLRFWMAAVRESIEEAGVAPGVMSDTAGTRAREARPAEVGAADAAPAEPDLQGWRHDLHQGRLSMAQALEAAGARLDGAALRCVARWVTPVWSPRRFDTRFFIAAMPAGHVVRPDGAETVDHVWLSPADALEAARVGRLTMIMPTVRTLVALDGHRTAQDAMAHMRFGDPSEPLLPEISQDRLGRRLAILRSDPEGNGGVYDSETGQPVTESPNL